MYQIKQIPEDFYVKEESTVKPGKEGNYAYFLLKKIDLTTTEAIRRISKEINLPLKFFGSAGNKDRKAVTEQVISIKNGSERSEVEIEGIKLKFLGKGNEPVSLGDLKGNHFEIIVKNAEKEPEQKKNFLNLFGEQRFSKNNIEIGREIVKGNFKKAVKLMSHKEIDEYLQERSTDFVGAVRTLQKNIRRLYVHAYQSFIWNKTVEEYSKNNQENIKIPIVGFGTEYENNEVEKIIKKILKQEDTTERDFIIKKLPDLSSEGDERYIFVEPKEMKIEQIDKKTYKLSFFLPKGSYATEIIRQLFL